jgi:hypothetical protein
MYRKPLPPTGRYKIITRGNRHKRQTSFLSGYEVVNLTQLKTICYRRNMQTEKEERSLISRSMDRERNVT